jgi:hypothetical protein
VTSMGLIRATCNTPQTISQRAHGPILDCCRSFSYSSRWLHCSSTSIHSDNSRDAIEPEKAAGISFSVRLSFPPYRPDHLPTGFALSFIIISVTFEHHSIHRERYVLSIPTIHALTFPIPHNDQVCHVSSFISHSFHSFSYSSG